jgi:L,D-transpeptidase YcbB
MFPDFFKLSRRRLVAGALSLPFAGRAIAQDTLPFAMATSIAPELATQGKLSTVTEIVDGRMEAPMISQGTLPAMEEAVALYEELAAAGGWTPLDLSAFTTKAKGRYITLRQRLVRENYLPLEALNVNQPDTVDDDLISALKTFQSRHGINPSGKMNERTVAEMNIPAEARLYALRENQPRVTEHLIGMGARAILVNIPSAQLETVDNGMVFSRHNVVAGKLTRPTPTLKSKITDVTFNPYWNAPASIVARDLIPKFLKDPTYLEQMQIRVFDGVGGPEIDPLTVDWEVTAADRYHFQQQPGEQNALAKVKVNFKNEHMVYMHDTPHREDFASNARFLSSGCVRVDQVRTFIGWILNGQDGFNDGLVEMITASQETTVTKVQTPTEVHFMYLTAWATADGHTNFRPDIYALDGKGFILGQPEPIGVESENL